MEFKDYYKVMGVKRDATQDEIKRAYRKLARKYHPDVSKESDAEERFKEVGEAYAVLKDPEKRTAYDQLGADWKKGQEFRPPPNWDQGFEFHGGDAAGRGPEEFSDFFETLFGQGDFRGGFTRADHRPYTARGEDTFAKIVVDLQDSYLGATRSVTLKHTEIGDDGRPTVRNRTLSVKIPKGRAPRSAHSPGQTGIGGRRRRSKRRPVPGNCVSTASEVPCRRQRRLPEFAGSAVGGGTRRQGQDGDADRRRRPDDSAAFENGTKTAPQGAGAPG